MNNLNKFYKKHREVIIFISLLFFSFVICPIFMVKTGLLTTEQVFDGLEQTFSNNSNCYHKHKRK